MNYSRIQKIISSFLLFIFFFGQIFGLSIFSLFSSNAYAENKTFYDLVSVIVTKEVYDNLNNDIERYAEDIQGYLDNTKVVILPLKEDSTAFQIASMNESLFYEGYKSLDSSVNFESRLIGTVLIGNIDLPIIEEFGKTTKSIVPFTDFEDKRYIYNHESKLFESNDSNIDGLKAEIFHGVVSPNTGDIESDIKKIKIFLDKDHDFYTGKNLFDSSKVVLNGKTGEAINGNYKPYVFYFDQIREQTSLNYSAYKGYEAYLNNKEDLVYHRYTNDFANRLQDEALGVQNEELQDILKNIDDQEIIDAYDGVNGADLQGVSDISLKTLIDSVTNKFLEVFNKGTLSKFRTNVHNAGRYNVGSSDVNVDMIPYLISVLDETTDKLIKSGNDDLEELIDDLVVNNLAKKIKIPNKLSIGLPLACNRTEYTNFFNGVKTSELSGAKDCSIYRGSTFNSGTLVEANRGLNILLTDSDVGLCLGSNPTGVYGGSSPLNLDIEQISSDLKFNLKSYNPKKAVLPIFDILGSKKVTDVTRNPSPLNCLDNNFIKTYKDSCDFIFNKYDVLNYDLPLNNWKCSSDNNIYTGNIKLENISGYSDIPSYIMHKSPTIDEINAQIDHIMTPNLPVDKERYIDFFSENVNSISKVGKNSYKKIIYPNLYDINGKDKEKIKNDINILLDNKSKELNNIGGTQINLKELTKNKPDEIINILGDKKTVNYFDFLAFSIYWNNLDSVSSKYKFIMENYLSDQISGNDFKFLLPKNKKQYEIAYLGADGDAQNMYIKMDPKLKLDNPYSNIISSNKLLNSNKISLGILNNDAKLSDTNALTDEGLFKCAPPEGVPIMEWLPAVMCRLGGLLPVEISLSGGSCGSSDIFESEDKDYYDLLGEEDSGYDGGGTSADYYNLLEEQQALCTNDSNKNGINDCVESSLNNGGKIKVTSDTSRLYYGQIGNLKTEIVDAEGKRILLDNSSYIKYDLKKIKDKTTGKVVYNNSVDDFFEKSDIINEYISFKPISLRSSYGTTGYSFSTKNKEADIYFETSLILNDSKNESIVTLDSNILDIKIRSDRLFLSSNSIDDKGKISLEKKSAISNNETNIYLFSGERSDIDTFSLNNNSLIFNLSNISEGDIKNNINFPLGIYLKDSVGKIIQKESVDSLDGLKELYKIKKSGSYSIKIIDKYGYNTESHFEVLAGKPDRLNIDLGSSVIESGGTTTTNLVSIYDMFDNIVIGENYKFDFNILGDSVIFEQNKLKKLTHYTFEGFKAFRLKSLDATGNSKIIVDLYKDDEKILSANSNIRVLNNIKMDVSFSDILKVGNNKYSAELTFKDSNNNIISDLNSRVYLSEYNGYIDIDNAYSEIKNGKATVNFSTKTLAKEDVDFIFRLEGFKQEIVKYVEILPGKAINISLIPNKKKLEASSDAEVYVEVELKDIYNNTVFTDNSSIISLELDDKYSDILEYNGGGKKLIGGVTNFKLNATETPGVAYLKFSINKSLEDNKFVIGEGDNELVIQGISKNAIKLETYYYYKKESLEGKSYNALYTTLLGAEYGDITKKDYLAGSIIFDENNRGLAVTSLLNSPYNLKSTVSILDNGTLNKIYEGSDLSQDINIKLIKNPDNIYYLDLFNDALNVHIGKIYLNFDDLNINDSIYNEIEKSKSFNLKKLFDIKDYTLFNTSNKIKLNNLLDTKKNSIVIFLESSEYSINKSYSKEGNSIMISYNDPFSSEFTLNTFSNSSYDTYDNFNKNEKLGWGAGNKTLLAFSSGNSVGDSTKGYVSAGLINLGDPIISLKKISKKSSNGINKKFDPTLGTKLNKNEILSYNVFDYNGDSRDDILLLGNNGLFSLLENTNSSKRFLDQKNLARVVDIGNIENVNTGDFSGDGFDDIFFVNNKGNPFLLDNTQKDFNRIDLTEEFNLKGAILQAKSFDMDNDKITDIVTLDENGEINIFYGRKNSNKFDKKLIHSGYGISLSSQARNDLGAIYFNGLTQESDIEDSPNGVIDTSLLESIMFENITYDTNTNPDLENYTTETTFIKSEFSSNVNLNIEKVFKDLTPGNLNTGDMVEVTVKIKNTGSRTINDIVYLENIPSYFELDSSSIKSKKEIKGPIGKYKFHISKFNLSPGTEVVITYKLKTKALSYSYIKVGLYEKAEAGDDLYGDIIVAASKYNCGGDVDIFRSINTRSYLKGLKVEKCDQSELPEVLEKNDTDDDDNGIPDYIDDIFDDDNSRNDFIEESNTDLLLDNEITEENDIFNNLDSLSENIDELSSSIDDLIQGFGCGFGGGSCFGMPLNWAPLAAGNDPVFMGHLIGDGLKVGEGIPVQSALNWMWVSGHCVPGPYPAAILGPGCTSPGAGGYLGTWSPTNYFRFYATPTLTGGAGIAACYGAPALASGNIPPAGLNPVVPGGNCIVAAAPLPNLCGDEEIASDPSSIGEVDYYGGSGGGNGNGGYGVINGNCSSSSNRKKLPISNKINAGLSDDYLNYRNTGVIGEGMKNSFIDVFKNPANPGVYGNSPLNEPLISINGGTLDSSDISIGVDFSDLSSGINFKAVDELTQKRVAPFPDFITGWVNDQLEEFITKLTDFPTLFVILPDLSGIFNADLGAYSDYLVNGTTKAYKSGVKKSNSLVKQTSGIKEAYEFLGNVPFVTIEGEPVDINIPWPRDSIDTTLEQWKLAISSYPSQIEEAVKSTKYKPEDIINAQKFMSSLQKNLQILESYKRIPEQIANLAGKKQEYLEQILCNIQAIGEVTGGWLDRNGKRFKSWVELYILIKAILKSWQLLADIFIDYEAQCHECKNERYDSLTGQFELVSMILPSFPIIEFPKWPDIVLDLHNIRLNLTILLPEFKFNKRPLILPPAPLLILPEPGLSINLPALDILPAFEIPELPDIPSLPLIKLPDLPPPPLLPKLFSGIEGFLNILKLITKAMCILKKSPFVPESRAGDQIAFLTEGSGYRPFDFLHLLTPKISYPMLDEIRVTTYVNLEFETDFIAEMAKVMVKPVNDMSNDFIHMFDSVDTTIDLSETLPSEVEINLESSVDNGDKFVTSGEFLSLVNKELSKESLIKDNKFDELRGAFDIVNNYTYSKENKLISDLKKAHYEKFDIIDSILQREITKQKDFKKEIMEGISDDIYKTISNNKIDDIKLYNTSLTKYNDAFKKSAKALINPEYFDTNELKYTGKKIVSNIKNTLDNYEKDVNKFKPQDKKFINASLVANTNNLNTYYASSDGNVNNNAPVCKSRTSNYKRNYEGIYIIQEQGSKKISYRLFDYLDDLLGDEVTTEIDFDLDGDSDLLYSMDRNLYLKENLINSPTKSYVSGVDILNSDDNKFINGDIYYEAINNANESFISNENININFLSSQREDINNYKLEYYNIIDKYLNEDNSLYIPTKIKKNIVDSFVDIKKNTIILEDEGIITRKNIGYIYEVGNNIPNVTLKTKELINLGKVSINGNNDYPVIGGSKQLYAGKTSAIIYYYKSDNDELSELKIEAYTNVKFPFGIKIKEIQGDIYIKTNKDISVKSNEIYNYVGLPISLGDIISNNGDLNYNSSSHIGIKYYDDSKVNIDFRKVDSYRLYDLGFKSSNYSISLSVDNDYLYSRIQAFKGNIYGTKSSQILLSPQIESDRYAPEINFNSKIRIPVYQDGEIIDLTNYIYEDSGFENITSLTIDGLDESMYEVLQTGDKMRIKFAEFKKPIAPTNLLFNISDSNGNSSSKKISFEVYTPIPQINNYDDGSVSGFINEKLTDEPINIYRYRGGVIKRLENTNGNTKVDTVIGKFNFDISKIESNLIDIKINNSNIFTINENTGKIDSLKIGYSINVLVNENNYIDINVLDISNNIVFTQTIKLNDNDITIVDSFNGLENNGLYFNLSSSDFDYYTLPDSAPYNPGSLALYRKADLNKYALFSILPDLRMKIINNRYKIKYSTFDKYIVLKFIDIFNNAEIGELLLKIDNTYIIK